MTTAAHPPLKFFDREFDNWVQSLRNHIALYTTWSQSISVTESMTRDQMACVVNVLNSLSQLA